MPNLTLTYLAHEDGIWACDWSRSEKDTSDYIVTGSVDDMVKLWKWFVREIGVDVVYG